MLASPNRLKQPRAIARVFKRGRQGTSGPIGVKAALNGTATSRAVVVVSKKVSKRAVVRNRIRRRIIAMIGERWATVAPGYDIVVTVHSNIAETPASELIKHLDMAIQRTKMITVS
ncbi:MAG TPA: ribonuclease P protein component [Candidatus Polarisedimenticolaceae bacterium]|nr:ribonuclease P protein component [Candidatus Polarisedimenticolaceae bacterium]